jgi:hypothetical protein
MLPAAAGCRSTCAPSLLLLLVALLLVVVWCGGGLLLLERGSHKLQPPV